MSMVMNLGLEKVTFCNLQFDVSVALDDICH